MKERNEGLKREGEEMNKERRGSRGFRTGWRYV